MRLIQPFLSTLYVDQTHQPFAMAATWSEVPLDIIYLLARSSVLGVSDLVRFGAVCRSWRALLTESHWFGCGPQLEALCNVSTLHLPKLMLAETDGSDDDTREFFDLATGRTFRLPLPEARQRRICGSNDGWVVTMGEDMEIHLLNPFTRQQIRLPSQLSFDDFGRGDTNEQLHGLMASMQELRDRFIDKAVIVGSPCSAGSCMVAAIVHPGNGTRVVVVRPGLDKSWTVLTCERSIITDVIHHKGFLYAISYGFVYHLKVWDMSNIGNSSLQEMKTVPISRPSPYPMFHTVYFYLVEVFGELVGVGRMHDYTEDSRAGYYTSRVYVYKVENGRWVGVKDLGDCCLFLGGNTSTFLSPVPSGFRRNCIYFTDSNFQGGCDMGVYNLDNDEYFPFYHGKLLINMFSPPIWVTLNPRRSMIK